MKYFLVFFFLFSNIGLASTGGEPPLWNSQDMVSLYHHNSFLQMSWAQNVIFENHTFKNNEKVIDYGSGDGKITALISKLIPNGEIIGLDISDDMTSFSRKKYPSFNYPNLRFQKVTSVDPIPESFNDVDIIYSSCVFHLVQNPEIVFHEMYRSLKIGGKLAVVFPFMDRETPLMRASAEVYAEYNISFPKMSDDSVSIRSTESGIQKMAERFGFKTLKMRVKESINPFISKKEFVDWIDATLSGNQVIPAEIRRVVAEKTVHKYLQFSPEDQLADGVIYYRFPIVEYVAQK
jgi:trans-aconitate 2-methyltransferase